MTVLLFLVIWGLIGTAVGRMLFVKRLKDKARFFVDHKTDEWGMRKADLSTLNTHDMSSAQTYGLWSIPFWPFTLAIFLVLLPTRAEKEKQRKLEYESLLKELELK